MASTVQIQPLKSCVLLISLALPEAVNLAAATARNYVFQMEVNAIRHIIWISLRPLPLPHRLVRVITGTTILFIFLLFIETCPAGFFCPDGNLEKNAPCSDDGFYCPPGSDTQDKCPPGELLEGNKLNQR